MKVIELNGFTATFVLDLKPCQSPLIVLSDKQGQEISCDIRKVPSIIQLLQTALTVYIEGGLQ